MNIFEFSEKYKISRAKARQIAKDNPVWFLDAPGDFDHIRASLMNGDKLTALQLIELIEQPSGLLELGGQAGKAQSELMALRGEDGRNPEAAPKEVSANIMEAAKGEPEAIRILVDWLKSIIPEKPVSHAFIAVRLLLGVPVSIRKSEGARIPRALLNARKQPDFAGWWHIAESRKNRNITVYQKLALANLDL